MEKGEEIILESYEKEIVDMFQNRIGKLVIYRDVTSERRAKQMLERSANTDELTGLYNRRYFYSNKEYDKFLKIYTTPYEKSSGY